MFAWLKKIFKLPQKPPHHTPINHTQKKRKQILIAVFRYLRTGFGKTIIIERLKKRFHLTQIEAVHYYEIGYIAYDQRKKRRNR
ncbi:hypothetical protein COT97_01800 [Candidatus Falkowbacteria bacterium CG10_big_fil_rev_8_21_14_0_10_39_11]|uniref:Uncharacterized protein n=1 Tax=Candidatus Falkowbacteria bacterium CG10_big_fil_rev_8_21_14_0_10_39_11 TaxID=1974565 RepID=A0A2H0V5H2_9BACT|nr:MAG: hypothetical protein COT97_01800 [Candidatus Falkowbacteria bacterium CG10_big_fil_rev_8_21_14_0_10_39_11]